MNSRLEEHPHPKVNKFLNLYAREIPHEKDIGFVHRINRRILGNEVVERKCFFEGSELRHTPILAALVQNLLSRSRGEDTAIAGRLPSRHRPQAQPDYALVDRSIRRLSGG
jgi:hypothetical protein